MSSLTRFEKIKIEKYLEMSGGYVLDFSNRTFGDFVFESIGIDVYGENYNYGGGSKANRLRALWDTGSDAQISKLLFDLVEYSRTKRFTSFRHETDQEKALEAECLKIAARLKEGGEGLAAVPVILREDDKTFSMLSRAVRESIERNDPQAGLDRLHTYVVRYIRTLCSTRGIVFDKEKSLHGAFGEYVKSLRKNGEIESEMADRILRFSISLLEAFNDVRNNQSLAHDNAILNFEESILIYNNVTSAIRFLESIEKKKNSRPSKSLDEDVPF